MKRILTILLVVPFFVKAQTGAFNFTLSNSSRTSAGVFKKDSTLVRTLWADRTYNAGTYTEYWDGKDDYGVKLLLPDANYDVRVLSNNVNYAWDGIIGNTSTQQTGSGVHRGLYNSMTGMAITGTTAYFCTGYSEGFPSQAKFSTLKPQVRLDLTGFAGQATMECDFVASDATNVYWAGFNAYSKTNSFVMATKVSDDSQVNFGTNGTSYLMTKLATPKQYTSVIDNLAVINSNTTGLAVQQSGAYLFVAHGGLNQLHVLNKTTGALVQNLSLSNPRCIATDGNYLWMVTGTGTVTKYLVNSNGTLSSAVLTLSGVGFPGSIAVSGSNLAIIDEGTNQIVRFFNTSTGAQGSQLGTTGGYVSGPAVTNTKYMFKDFRGHTFSFLAYSPDGSFWMGDASNYRELHFTSSKTLIETIMSMGGSFSVCTDPNNINRLFGNYLEFAINYSQPLTGKTGWSLVNNWGYNSAANTFGKRLLNVTTLSNGRTYGIDYDIGSGLVELTTTGLRKTGTTIRNGPTSIGNGVINIDGSLTKFSGSFNIGSSVIYTRYPLTGFDAANNPIWSKQGTILASTPPNTMTDPNQFPGNMSPTSYNFVTASNKVIFFNPSKYYAGVVSSANLYNGYHLGAIKFSSNKWAWKTQKADNIGYYGAFPEADCFEIGNNGNQYAGINFNVVGNNIITGYHGEFWKNGQTNYYNHYWEDGLAVGQFGTDSYISPGIAAVGKAGNALSVTVVKNAGGNFYLYHGDASHHAGLHRWSITNLSSISEQSINVLFPAIFIPQVLSYVDLHKGLPFLSTLPTSVGWSKRGTVTSNTSLKKYIDDGSPDVYSFSSISSGTAAVNRDLGTNNVINNWKISGQLSFEKSDFVVGSATKQYVDVLDAAGKIIARFNYIGNPNTKMVALYGNNSIIDNSTTVSVTLNQFQPFEVNAVNGAVTFIYANYPPLTTTIFDATANWRQPETLRQYWTGSGTPARGMYIGCMDMKFYIDYVAAIGGAPSYFTSIDTKDSYLMDIIRKRDVREKSEADTVY